MIQIAIDLGFESRDHAVLALDLAAPHGKTGIVLTARQVRDLAAMLPGLVQANGWDK